APADQQPRARAELDPRPSKASANDDELLEACEEPIALPGSAHAPVAAPLKAVEPAEPFELADRPDLLHSPAPPPVIIPEELKLASSSELDARLRPASAP